MKKGQQEMVGFVLIIVLVIIALLIGLTITLRNQGNKEPLQDQQVEQALQSILEHTSNCAINFEPNYDNYEELFKSCEQQKNCKNLQQSACEHLNNTLPTILERIYATEAKTTAYKLDSYAEETTTNKPLISIQEGNCNNKASKTAQKRILYGTENIIIRLQKC
jgi:hypothetical protein